MLSDETNQLKPIKSLERGEVKCGAIKITSLLKGSHVYVELQNQHVYVELQNQLHESMQILCLCCHTMESKHMHHISRDKGAI